MESYLGHIVHEQQWDGDGGDVVRAANFEDVAEAHDGRVSSREVSRAHVIIHAQMKHYVNLGQVGMTSDVEFACKKPPNISDQIMRSIYSDKAIKWVFNSLIQIYLEGC